MYLKRISDHGLVKHPQNLDLFLRNQECPILLGKQIMCTQLKKMIGDIHALWLGR